MEQTAEFSVYRPRPSDLPAFLPFACGQLEAPFRLRVLVDTAEEYAAVDTKGKRATTRDKATPQVPSATRPSAEREPSGDGPEPADEGDVVLRAHCDALGRPVELAFHRCQEVPRLLLKIIGLCVPFHDQLTKITVRGVPLDGAAVHEIAKFLPLSQVTDLSFDDSPATHRNYHLLLERPSLLRGLSLARCDLRDEECALLAARLAHPAPAARRLALLELQANRIGDAGARALGDALRTNRALRHLNLAGNAIGAEGAAHLLRSLAGFPVTRDEIVTKRRRTFDYLKLRRDAYARCYRELTHTSEPVAAEAAASRGRRRTVTPRSHKGSASTLASVKSSGADALASRAEAMAAALVGPPGEPLAAGELAVRDGVMYCAGNFALSYLNLAYNELDCTSVRRLAAVLQCQARAGAAAGRAAGGLRRVVLEGNALDAGGAGAGGEAARAAAELLERAQGEDAAPALKLGRKSERAKLKGY